MKRLCHFICVVTCVLLILQSARLARADLAGQTDAILQDKLLARAEVGVEVVRLGASAGEATVLLDHNAAIPLTPASNLKLVTTSAALDRLGADFNFRTLLLGHDNDVIIVGDGDPTLGDAELLKKFGWDVDTVFKNWAGVLKRQNITQINNVIVDDGVFDRQFIHPHWPADQLLERYVAEVAGLNLNANCLDFYFSPKAGLATYAISPRTDYVRIKNELQTGRENSPWISREPDSNDLTIHGQINSTNLVPVSVTIHDPPLYCGTVFSEVLKSNGVQMGGSVQRDISIRAAYAKAQSEGDSSWRLLAVHQTPLEAVISRANKDSMNLYAECLSKRLGFAARGAGTWANGVQTCQEFLAGLGVAPTEYQLDDGCGLSKKNAISPHALATVLIHDFYSANSRMYLSTLAVGGVDGTLENRFKESDLRGRVLAKSGYVEGVSCLSGFLHAHDNNWYAFSIMFRGIPRGSNLGAKAIQERIVKAIDSETRRR